MRRSVWPHDQIDPSFGAEEAENSISALDHPEDRIQKPSVIDRLTGRLFNISASLGPLSRWPSVISSMGQMLGGQIAAHGCWMDRVGDEPCGERIGDRSTRPSPSPAAHSIIELLHGGIS